MNTSERQISIQPANTRTGEYDVRRPRPYPFHIGNRGQIGRQDFWQGEPLQLVGFQLDTDVQHVDLMFAQFWAEPQSAVGMFPVFLDADGEMWSHPFPIKNVTEHESSEAV